MLSGGLFVVDIDELDLDTMLSHAEKITSMLAISDSEALFL